MGKYKIGNTFKATLEITDVYEDENEIYFKVVELDIDGYTGLLEEYYTFGEVDEAFDPNHKERKRLGKIRELEEELEKLKND